MQQSHKAQRRRVTAARTLGTNWVITEGLRAGERVITQAPITVRHGSEVRPVPQGAPQRVGAPARAGQAAGSD